ncbi:MAG: WecB/TagA/CpsF family glycosyltransferase [Candidatus Gygaella obscura]|nr:WecB/TagA/CpsF family glycosyltransferase [Candidatus Gygaella obscura]
MLGINIAVLTKQQIVQKLIEFSRPPMVNTVFYLNAHCINLASVDADYRKILINSDIVYSGGFGVVWASSFLGKSLPERVNILDFFDELTSHLIENKTKVYLLGDEDIVIKACELELKGKGINIVGCHSGFFGDGEEKSIIENINRLSPDILMVGMGVPRQEKWISRNKSKIKANLIWGVGGAFCWLSGKRKRAPRWMINSGFEWFYRLMQEPKRLRSRYVFGNIVFLSRVLFWKIRRID